MRNLYVILFMLFIGVNSFGQKIRNLDFVQLIKLMNQLIKDNPELKARLEMADIELSKNSRANFSNTGTITIPIVIYIIHDNQPLGVR